MYVSYSCHIMSA